MRTQRPLAISPAWLSLDQRLLSRPDEFELCERAEGYSIWKRRMPDDPNDLFRWEIHDLGAPHDRVFEIFVRRILDYHQHWTKEFVGGRVVAEPGPDTQVLYQQFDPGLPGVKKRDLCHVTVTRRLDDGSLLASHRSVDAVPEVAGFERIRWWGASLCVPGRAQGRSTLIYLDRENQGGAFPAWLMNLLMPRYLRYQCERLIELFAQGGPVGVHAKGAATAGAPLPASAR
jgi:hypothetical protein